MSFFLRHVLPITYFQATRLNRWELVGYNALVEWLPAFALSLFYNNFEFSIVPLVLLSYLAFISIYEIGYITNDFFSERFENDPRGRAEKLDTTSLIVFLLIGTRLLYFLVFSYILGALGNPLWWAFHGTLLLTFGLHNSIPSEMRIPTFFGLSTFRFLAPVILTLKLPLLAILLPTIMINNSLYRVTVYLRNKDSSKKQVGQNIKFKLVFYVGCLPFSILLSVIFGSILPIGVCLYFFLVWLFYWTISKRRGNEFEAA